MMNEPIRVLHVVTHMNRGGLETMIMNYYRKIDKSLIQFDFLTHRPIDEKKDYEDEILNMGGRIYHISRLNPFSPAYHSSLDSFLKKHPEYSIIHVHQDCLSGIILRHAKKAGIPVRIAHCHSSNQDKNLLYPIKLFYKRNIRKYATKMIACGEVAGKWMFGLESSFDVLPNAIDSEQYTYSHETRMRLRKELKIAPDTLVIGHVGRFCTVKNHSFLIDVFKEVLNINSNALLVLVGQGETMDYARSKVHDLDMDAKVLFLGLRKDVAELLQMMDVFVLPSIYEGVPVSIIEAQAAGLKCVISSGVPLDCKVTNLVTQLDLEKGIDVWSQQIISNSVYQRMSTSEQINKAHYDIVENVKWLQDLYLSESVK